MNFKFLHIPFLPCRPNEQITLGTIVYLCLIVLCVFN